jgi:hypothetical protein
MMCPDDRTVDHVGPAIAFHRTGQRFQHGVEHIRRRPATVAAEHAVPLAIFLRQMPPLRTRPRDPHHALEEGAVVTSGTTATSALGR